MTTWKIPVKKYVSLNFSTQDTPAASLTEDTEFTKDSFTKVLENLGLPDGYHSSVIEVDNKIGGKTLIHTNLNPLGHKSLTESEAFAKINTWYPDSKPGSLALANNRGNYTHYNPNIRDIQLALPMAMLEHGLSNFHDPNQAINQARDLGQLCAARVSYIQASNSKVFHKFGERVFLNQIAHAFEVGLAQYIYEESKLDPWMEPGKMPDRLFKGGLEILLEDIATNLSDTSKKEEEKLASFYNTRQKTAQPLTTKRPIRVVSDEMDEATIVDSMFEVKKPYQIRDLRKPPIAQVLNDCLESPFDPVFLKNMDDLTKWHKELTELPPVFYLMVGHDDVKMRINPNADFNNCHNVLALTIMEWAMTTIGNDDLFVQTINAMRPTNDERTIKCIMMVYILTVKGELLSNIQQLSIDELLLYCEPIDDTLLGVELLNPYGWFNLNTKRMIRQPLYPPPCQFFWDTIQDKAGYLQFSPEYDSVLKGNDPVKQESSQDSKKSNRTVISRPSSSPETKPGPTTTREKTNKGKMINQMTQDSLMPGRVGMVGQSLTVNQSDLHWTDFSSLAIYVEKDLVVAYRSPLHLTVVYLLVLAGYKQPPPYTPNLVYAVIWVLRTIFNVQWVRSSNSLSSGYMEWKMATKEDKKSKYLERYGRTETQMKNFHKKIVNKKREQIEFKDEKAIRAIQSDNNWKVMLSSDDTSAKIKTLVQAYASHKYNSLKKTVQDLYSFKTATSILDNKS